MQSPNNRKRSGIKVKMPRSQHRAHTLRSSDIIHNSTACLFIESLDLLQHLHHLEWSSHGNRLEQKHPSLEIWRLNAPQKCICQCVLMKCSCCPNHWGLCVPIKQESLQRCVLHTSESLVACCHGKWALLHGQLVKLAELWGDSSRGRLWEWERGQEEEWRKQGNTAERKAQQTRRSIHAATPRNNIKTSTAYTTVIYSERPCVYGKSDADAPYLCC